MRRRVPFLLVLLFPLIGLTPAAEATSAAVCAINGRINFSPLAGDPTQGSWSISPATISCQGLFRGYERITGPGEFSGSGTYSENFGREGCLHLVGSGDVDYRMQTTETDVHIMEPHEFVLAGAGAFTTPSLDAAFQVLPPYQGDCVTEPLTKASFVAEGLFTRGGI